MFFDTDRQQSTSDRLRIVRLTVARRQRNRNHVTSLFASPDGVTRVTWSASCRHLNRYLDWRQARTKVDKNNSFRLVLRSEDFIDLLGGLVHPRALILGGTCVHPHIHKRLCLEWTYLLGSHSWTPDLDGTTINPLAWFLSKDLMHLKWLLTIQKLTEWFAFHNYTRRMIYHTVNVLLMYYWYTLNVLLMYY